MLGSQSSPEEEGGLGSEEIKTEKASVVSPRSLSSSNESSLSSVEGKTKYSNKESLLQVKRARVAKKDSSQNSGKTTPRTQRLNKLYDEIKNKDDGEIELWQRQLKVNRFMIEVEMNKTIETMLQPIMKTHEHIKQQLEVKFVKVLEDSTRRLQLLEQTVYGKAGAEHRFEAIEKAQSELRIAQMQQNEFHKDQHALLETKLNNNVFELKNGLAKAEALEIVVNDLGKRMEALNENVSDYFDKIQLRFGEFQGQMQQQSEKLSNRILKASQEQYIVTDRLEVVEQKQQQNWTRTKELDQQVREQKAELVALTDNKLDSKLFQQFAKMQDGILMQMRLQVDLMDQDVKNTGNYLQKHIPMQVQRTITHVLGFVFPQRDVAWRLNWYNEIRIPMLAAAMLSDEGVVNLQKKMKEMTALLDEYPTTVMELSAEAAGLSNKNELLSDERMITNVVNSMRLHTKAKQIIFQRLDEMEKERKSRGIESQGRDTFEALMDFEQLQQMVFDLIIKEDPVEAKKLGILGEKQEAKDLGVGRIQEEEDNGLEAQVLEIVDKYCKQLENQFNQRLRDQDQSWSAKMEEKVESLNGVIRQEMSQTEKQLEMLHNMHMLDFGAVKSAAKNFLDTSMRMDMKIQMFINLEKEHQSVLRHLRQTSALVESLTQLALQQHEGKQRSHEVDDLADEKDFFTKRLRSSISAERSLHERTSSSADEHRGKSVTPDEFFDAQNQILDKQSSAVISKATNYLKSKASHLPQSSASAAISNRSFDANLRAGGTKNMPKKVVSGSTKSVYNQTFMQRTKQQFKPYLLGTSIATSPGSQELTAMAGLVIGTSFEMMAGDGVLSTNANATESDNRPKSQAASGVLSRIKRRSNLVNASAAVMPRRESVNGGPCFPSEFSRGDILLANFKSNRSRLQTQTSFQTTQNERQGKMCNKHASLVSNQRSENQISEGLIEEETQPDLQFAQQVKGFDRVKAIKKLHKLGSEARQLSLRIENMIIPDATPKCDIQETVKKLHQQHRRGLNNLPNAEKFKKELQSFKARLEMPSKADQMIKKSGGIMNQLHFATPGVNMRFGIGHRAAAARDMPKTAATPQTHMTPNRLACQQEFEQVECKLDVNHLQQTVESSQDRPRQKSQNASREQRHHIFCKKEVVNSVNRVL